MREGGGEGRGEKVDDDDDDDDEEEEEVDKEEKWVRSRKEMLINVTHIEYNFAFPHTPKARHVSSWVR